MSLEKENQSTIPGICIIDKETEKFLDWMTNNDLCRTFREAGNIVCWSNYHSSHKLLVHIIQPNHLHSLCRFDSEANMLITVVKDFTKEQMIKYLKENTNIKNPLILDYDELDHSDESNDLNDD